MSRELEVALAVVALAVAALLVVVPWLTGRRRRARVRSWARGEFRSDDPARRAAAAVTMVSFGLQKTAPDVLEFVTHERSDAVLDQVADAATHHRWEPNTGPEAVALKAWAAARRRWAYGELGTPPRTAVLVTGAGGPAGVAVIQELLRLGYRVHAVDSSPYGSGLGLAQSGAVVPSHDDPAYPAALLAELRTSGCGVLVSTLAEEFGVLDRMSEQLDEAGVARWLPPQHAVDRCLDKYAFYQAASAVGVPVPETEVLDPPPPGTWWRSMAEVRTDVPGPWIVKPRAGRGSREVYACDSAEELCFAARRADPAVVQRRVAGREFTVDMLVDRDGDILACVPRWRLVTRSGISVVGETFRSAPVRDAVASLVAAIGLHSAINVQGFLDPSGRAWITECNPRLSGALPLTLGAGCDLVGQYVRMCQGLAPQPGRLSYTPGVLMTRWYEQSVAPGPVRP